LVWFTLKKQPPERIHKRADGGWKEAIAEVSGGAKRRRAVPRRGSEGGNNHKKYPSSSGTFKVAFGSHLKRCVNSTVILLHFDGGHKEGSCKHGQTGLVEANEYFLDMFLTNFFGCANQYFG